MTTKTQVMVSLDSDLIEKFRQTKGNLSGRMNDFLKAELDKSQPTQAQIDKLQLELIKNKEKTEVIKTEISILKEKLLKEEMSQIEKETKLKQEAQEKAQAYKKKIAQEITYWPQFINAGFMRSANKREAHFRRRAKILEMPIEDYLTEIVAKCDKAAVL